MSAFDELDVILFVKYKRACEQFTTQYNSCYYS